MCIYLKRKIQSYIFLLENHHVFVVHYQGNERFEISKNSKTSNFLRAQVYGWKHFESRGINELMSPAGNGVDSVKRHDKLSTKAKSIKCSLFISINIVSGKRWLFSKTKAGNCLLTLFAIETMTRHFFFKKKTIYFDLFLFV